MIIACSTLCFTAEPFDRACAYIADLGFQAVDIALMEQWAHFNPSEMVDDPSEAIDKAREGLDRAGLTAVSMNASAGISDVGPEGNRLRAICTFANAFDITTICYVPPIEAVGMERAQRRFERLHSISQEFGVTLAIEAHARTMLEMPDMAVEFCRAIPGIALTFDSSHMVAGQNQGAPYDQIFPYVQNTHWRDSGTSWDQCQQPLGEGVVDFDHCFSALAAVGYDGVYSVEYIDSFPNGGIAQVEAMQRLLEARLYRPAS
ncbi:sugar phosphate isomerase/epimerase [Candidatus Poribacteria bacterium]|jgi:sugar phosphate isomerase/epimerase|nr:sugar phosphate isomerase/epimerase [Candidatus Poribacteria bacterium]MBT5532329.1 sugar phosphate isomerase/epimerase [Candidatus Poribacteria bacterium]MBT5712248.1 sugar phosphate isomerase/epimerase [Candidatus Poribacteria bacterium]MBT7099280.1 sugar phosphate isomerase/epimerase [Candidatus Poribacteria bacterium]MBT7804859.1 sugar phosphate isomerase/epimerase [Candidatus Poribacteria bacterium]